jgi:glutamate-1-semialdehyde 2,1-aminomutase
VDLALWPWRRLQLSQAKHRSLAGHPRLARRLASWFPHYEYSRQQLFALDGAPAHVRAQREEAWAALSRELKERTPQTHALAARIRGVVSDAALVHAYRVPSQVRSHVQRDLPASTVVTATQRGQVCDLDGNWCWDLAGSYGVNLLGSDYYKGVMQAALDEAEPVGLHLGANHPLVAEVGERLTRLMGMDEVSFHMSGTEAVMQAVRLARHHTGRPKVVRFAGAYHGWGDGVHTGVGNPAAPGGLLTLAEMSERTLALLRTRHDVAAVLVNPVQAMHPNASPPTDAQLVTGVRRAAFDKAAYAAWLRDLRAVCDARRIVFILDDVFLGFRLARGGSQEYFGVRADLVTLGKTLGGGFPVGVVVGRRALMRRFRHDRPGQLVLARGTFNAHPVVVAGMREFLRHMDTQGAAAAAARADEVWNRRAALLNKRLQASGAPVGVANLVSVWAVTFPEPGRYHWLLQYYLRAAGLALSWVGTGRLIFSHDLSDRDFEEIANRFDAAVRRMQADGWFWRPVALDAKTIQRQVLRESISARLRRGSSGRSTPL